MSLPHSQKNKNKNHTVDFLLIAHPSLLVWIKPAALRSAITHPHSCRFYSILCALPWGFTSPSLKQINAVSPRLAAPDARNNAQSCQLLMPPWKVSENCGWVTGGGGGGGGGEIKKEKAASERSDFKSARSCHGGPEIPRRLGVRQEEENTCTCRHVTAAGGWTLFACGTITSYAKGQ